MGQDEVARLIADTDTLVPLPDSAAADLSFELGLQHE